jgi:hypothetical protein
MLVQVLPTKRIYRSRREQLLGLDEFHLEIFEIGTSSKPPLQGTIRDPAWRWRECDGLFQNFLELHDRSSTYAGVASAQV